MSTVKFTAAFIPGVVGAGLLWHTVVNCLPYKLMSPSLSGLAVLGLVLGLATSVDVGVLAVAKPHPVWPVIGAALGLGLPYSIVAARTLSLAATFPREPGDFSWPACVRALNHSAFQAAGLVFVLALFGSVMWVLQYGWRLSKTRGA